VGGGKQWGKQASIMQLYDLIEDKMDFSEEDNQLSLIQI